MSISSEITRLQTARNTIRNKMVNLGLSESSDTLTELAADIDGIVNRGAVSASVMEGDSYTIPEGYHNGSGTVMGVAGGGSYNLQSKEATPTTSQQSVTPDQGYYGLSAVTVKPIPANYKDASSVDAVAANILANKIAIGVDGNGNKAQIAGTMPNNGAVSATLDARAVHRSYTIPEGYHSGSGTVSVVTEQKTATPTEMVQLVKATDGKVLAQVQVDPIPGKYQDVQNCTADPAHVLSGKTFGTHGDLDASPPTDGQIATGTMTNNGAVTATFDGTTTTSYTVPAGYHNGSGTVSLDNTIETALAAI